MPLEKCQLGQQGAAAHLLDGSQSEALATQNAGEDVGQQEHNQLRRQLGSFLQNPHRCNSRKSSQYGVRKQKYLKLACSPIINPSVLAPRLTQIR